MRVPPARYGGTERIVAELTAELVRRGHDVTLFAAATSFTAARLWSVAPRPLWELTAYESFPYEIAQVETVARNAASFDIIHWHLDFLHWLVVDQLPTPSVTTMHGRLDTDSVRLMFAAHPEHPVISISDSQMRPVSDLALNWVATIHHGLDLAGSFRLGGGDGGYLAFVGRSSADKGLATAIRIAIRTGTPIKIGARVGPPPQVYHESEVEPLLDHPLVEWLGEISDAEKAVLLEGAKALIMPIEWEEPFGLSFIESLAAGTPIITRARGALPEIMRDGLHGYFVDTEDDMVQAIAKLDDIDRAECRRWALDRFSTQRMVDDYEYAYRRVLDAGTISAPARVSAA
ncbi:MAG TPA: glycosyltransferase family 4 protein [Candidatus Dormibacteraeota bacterium]|nr:glycosyltransferase family 4 protein [Candidatus Dormibacteraeota bacterium]